MRLRRAPQLRGLSEAQIADGFRRGLIAFVGGVAVPTISGEAGAFVQANLFDVGTSGTTLGTPYPGNVVAGNLLICFAGWDTAAGSATATDTLGNVWTPIAGSISRDGSGPHSGQFLWARSKSSGANTVTITVPTSTFRMNAILEYSGLEVVAQPDASAGTTGQSGANPSVSVTSIDDHDLLVAGCITGGNVTAGAGFNSRAFGSGNGVEDFLDQTPAGSKTLSFVDSSNNWAASAIALRITGPGVDVGDDFNRANESPLAGNWTQFKVSASAFDLTSNVVTLPFFSGDAHAYWNPNTPANDQFSEAALTVTGTGGAGQGIGLLLRTDGSNTIPTHYRFVADHAATNNVEISRFNGGSITSLKTVTQAWTNGDTWRAEIRGYVISLYLNGTLVTSYDDSASGSKIASGRVGIAYSSVETSPLSIDNWRGGDLPPLPASTLIGQLGYDLNEQAAGQPGSGYFFGYVIPPDVTTIATTPVSSALDLPIETAQALASSEAGPVEDPSGLATSGVEPVESFVGGIANSAVEQVEANQGVPATGADPIEQSQGIAASGSEPIDEAKGGISTTSADPVSATQGIAQTDALTEEASQGIATSAADPLDEAQGIAQSGSEPLDEAKGGITSTAADPFEAFVGGIAAASAYPVETLAGGINTSTLEPVEVIVGGIASSGVDPFEATRGGIAAPATDPAEATGGVATTGPFPISATQGVAQTSSDPYESTGLAAVSTTAAFPVESFVGGVASSRLGPVEALQRIIAPAAVSAPVTFTDNFNRANSGSLGTGWTPLTTAGGFEISGNEAAANLADHVGNFRNAETYGDDQYAQVTVTTTPVNYHDFIGVLVRAYGAGDDFYTVFYFNNNPVAGNEELRLYKRTAGTFGFLAVGDGSVTVGTLSPGDVIRIEAHGMFIKAYLNGVLKLAAVDTDHPSGGAPGVFGFGFSHVDNYDGGDLAPAGAPPIVTDDFNRADGANFGGSANWQKVTSLGMPSVTSNRIAGVGGTVGGAWANGTFGNDQASQITGMTVGGGDWFGVTARDLAPASVQYLAIAYATGPPHEVRLYKLNGPGSYTQLGSSYSIPGGTISGSDVLRIEATGSTIRALYNGVTAVSVTDTLIPGGGAPGLAIFGTASADNWQGEGGDLAPGVGMPVEAPGGVAATGADPLDVLQGIVTPGSDPYEAAGMTAVSTTSSFPVEASKGGITSSVTEPVSASGGVAQSGADPAEAGGGVASTGSEPVEALAGVAASASDPLDETRGGISSTDALVYETSSGLVTSASFTVESLAGGIASALVFAVEALAAVASSTSDPYESGGLAAIVASGVFPFEVVAGGITTSALVPLEAASGLTTNVAGPVESVGGISTLATEPLEALQGLVASSGLPFESTGLVGIVASAALPFEAIGAALSTLGLPLESVAVLSPAAGLVPYEAASGLLTATALPDEAPGGLASTRGLPLDALGVVITIAVLPIEADGQPVAIIFGQIVGTLGRGPRAESEPRADRAMTSLVIVRATSVLELAPSPQSEGVSRRAPGDTSPQRSS